MYLLPSGKEKNIDRGFYVDVWGIQNFSSSVLKNREIFFICGFKITYQDFHITLHLTSCFPAKDKPTHAHLEELIILI